MGSFIFIFILFSEMILLTVSQSCNRDHSFSTISEISERTGWGFHRLTFLEPDNPVRDEAASEDYFTQKLDHFHDDNNQVWKQRYFVNNRYCSKTRDCPVFLLLSGEAPAHIKWMSSGQWTKNAEKYGALMFYLEHRFYGESKPKPDISTASLRYLSSDQALQDTANFIRSKQQEYNMTDNNKWIVFGGSYPGNLAAWMRLKFPDLITGAIASSAPVQAQVNFPEYMEVVTKSLDFIQPGCSAEVHQATTMFNYLLGTRKGTMKLSEMFKLCCPLEPTNLEDVATFTEGLAGYFAIAVQGHNNVRGGTNINTVCDIMTNKSLGNPLIRYAEVNKVFLKAFKEDCLEAEYRKYKERLTNSSYGVEPTFRGWTYQSCNEFGYFQTTDSLPPKQVFGNTFGLNYFLKSCNDLYFPQFSEKDMIHSNVRNTNDKYGGKDIAERSSNILFVNGRLDPWNVLGIPDTYEHSIHITGASHCADMYSDRESDSDEMKEARNKISNYIGKWLDLAE